MGAELAFVAGADLQHTPQYLWCSICMCKGQESKPRNLQGRTWAPVAPGPLGGWRRLGEQSAHRSFVHLLLVWLSLGMLTPSASLCSHTWQLRWEDLSEFDETIMELGIGSSWELEVPKAQVRWWTNGREELLLFRHGAQSWTPSQHDGHHLHVIYRAPKYTLNKLIVINCRLQLSCCSWISASAKTGEKWSWTDISISNMCERGSWDLLWDQSYLSADQGLEHLLLHQEALFIATSYFDFLIPESSLLALSLWDNKWKDNSVQWELLSQLKQIEQQCGFLGRCEYLGTCCLCSLADNT